MNTEEKTESASGEELTGRTPQQERHPAPAEERNDAWWVRVYVAVIIVTVLVITCLWLFSRAFSS